MKQFIAFVRKEFYHILRDKRTLLILIGMPIVQIILFGFAISTEVKNVQTAILVSSTDTDTRYLIDRIDANEYFTVKYIVHSPEELEVLFRKNKIELAIAFPPDFNRQLFDTEQIQIIADATDPNLALTRSSYASGIIRTAQATLADAGKVHPSLLVHNRLLYNPQMKSAYNFVPGVMGLILMLICAMMTSISIVREKETGTMEVLLVSPVRPLWMIIAKMVPYFVLSCVNLVTILLLSVYVLHVPVAGSLFSLALLSWIFIVVSLLLGLLVSTIARTQVEAMLFSGMVLMMPTVLLSGMIFPIENMPLPLQLISNVIPARWYIVGIKKIMIEGLGISYAQREMGILMLMAVVLLIISLKKFNKRLE